ncbi:MAG: methionine synthase [Chloroflexi bacterium]|nr:methionine synthase [Chloroflexota bacterium]
MPTFAPRALATGIGSMPHMDPRAALRVVFDNVPDVPFWPQLPCRDFRENMYVQYSQELPTVQIDEPHEWIGAVTGEDTLAQVESFYARYLADDPNLFAVGEEYAAGLYALQAEPGWLRQAKWVKGQVTGPISMGLKITDQNLRPILYDDTLRDVLVKHIARMAQWHERFLSELGTCLTFVDEPSLALIGASVVALNGDEVIRDLEEVYASLKGLKGTHCCGNTDWSLLLQTSVDVISFDAYSYAENLALFADDVRRFLDRGGALAWGIVPTVEEHLARETTEHLVERLDAAAGLLIKKGIDRDLLYERALITPACGLGPLSVTGAEQALALTRRVSERVREREGLVTDP